MDGRHDHRGAGGDRRPRPDHLGAEHVRVDEVDLLAPQPGHELADGDLVIGRVEHVHRDAERAEALHGRARRQREGADLVSGSVQAEQQSGVALLGAAVAAGREQLEDARARMAAGPMDPPMPGVRRTGDGALVVGLSHRPMLARTAERRFIGHAMTKTARHADFCPIYRPERGPEFSSG